MAARFIAAVDHGTTSTRCILFTADGRPAAIAQREQTMHYPRPGWVELDMEEVWQRTTECIHDVLHAASADRTDVAAIGIANERETVVLWDRRTGRPVARAITWQDTRTAGAVDALAADGGVHRFQERTGLPVSTYSSALKLQWLLDEDPARRAAAQRGDLLFGTPDTWLLWNLTGGPDGGVHATDPTNASRTLLMDLRTLEWDDDLLETMRIPRAVLPEIRSSSEVYGNAVGDLSGVPVAGILGDQPASLFGHTCFDHGDVKNTYGTGAFLLSTLGTEPVISKHGLITTVAWKLGAADPVYALEGSVAMAGALVQWLRDNLGLISDAAEVEALAGSVADAGGVTFVPAFSGLFAPYWRDDARGVIVGLTRFANKGHIARAALEAAAYQTYDLAEAMLADTGLDRLGELRADGGMTNNNLLMQFQADVLGSPVVAPAVAEITATGAAYAAGLAAGFWDGLDALRANYTVTRAWQPQMDGATRDRGVREWRRAVERTLGLATAAADPQEQKTPPERGVLPKPSDGLEPSTPSLPSKPGRS
jgi:glycerol kinase